MLSAPSMAGPGFINMACSRSAQSRREATIELAKVGSFDCSELIIRTTSLALLIRAIDVTAADELCAGLKGTNFHSFFRRCRAGVRIILACPAPAPTEPPMPIPVQHCPTVAVVHCAFSRGTSGLRRASLSKSRAVAVSFSVHLSVFAKQR